MIRGDSGLGQAESHTPTKLEVFGLSFDLCLQSVLNVILFVA